MPGNGIGDAGDGDRRVGALRDGDCLGCQCRFWLFGAGGVFANAKDGAGWRHDEAGLYGNAAAGAAVNYAHLFVYPTQTVVEKLIVVLCQVCPPIEFTVHHLQSGAFVSSPKPRAQRAV